MDAKTVIEWHQREAKNYEDHAKKEHCRPATVKQFHAKAKFHREAAECISALSAKA